MDAVLKQRMIDKFIVHANREPTADEEMNLETDFGLLNEVTAEMATENLARLSEIQASLDALQQSNTLFVSVSNNVSISENIST